MATRSLTAESMLEAQTHLEEGFALAARYVLAHEGDYSTNSLRAAHAVLNHEFFVTHTSITQGNLEVVGYNQVEDGHCGAFSVPLALFED